MKTGIVFFGALAASGLMNAGNSNGDAGEYPARFEASVETTARPWIMDEGTTGTLSWSLTDTGTLTISGEGAMPDYKFIMGGNRNTTSPWTNYKSDISKIVISDGVTSIGRWAFGCAEVQLIVGVYAGVTDIVLPGSLTSIGLGAFSGCSTVEKIRIPDNVTTIGERAFYECLGLKSITIPAGVTSIGDEAFGGCSNLRKIDVASGNRNFSSKGGVLFDRNKTMLIMYPIARNGNYAIPAGVTSIAKGAFAGHKGLAGVSFPDGLTTIGESAFSHCSGLREITLPGSLAEIGDVAFEACTGLESLKIPGNVRTVGAMAFHGCFGLKSIMFDEGLTEIGSWAFRGCRSLPDITIPDTVTKIGNWAFSECTGLESATIGSGVTEIQSGAFEGCTSLANVTIRAAMPPALRDFFIPGGSDRKSTIGFPVVADILHVPAGREEAYRASAHWNEVFQTITGSKETK
jgi:hypothetical protein